MFCYVMSAGIRGINGYMVRVEADISPGMPMLEMVGYLSSEVKEAAQRVRTALRNTDFTLPISRVTVNLSPANIRKAGTGFDLPIALSLLACMKEIPMQSLNEIFAVGELMLSGEVSGVTGALPMLLEARKNGIKKCIIPEDNLDEAALVDGMEIIGVRSLAETVEYLKGERIIQPSKCYLADKLNRVGECGNDFAYVAGQKMAKRGIEIGAAGLHNILMVGPPGSGKTMLAKCIPSILPPLSEAECLEVSSIYSVRKKSENKQGVVLSRPFVSAHHTATDIALIGGGAVPKPGAVSMAHTGVLFLDELPEFSRKALEAMRQPLEDRSVSINRNNDICVFPADFMLVASMNPCPCGYYPDYEKCNCTESSRIKYVSKISGPLMDRIDICINVAKVPISDFAQAVHSESSQIIRKRVIKAHLIQQERFSRLNISFNSQMGNEEIKKYCVLGNAERQFIDDAAKKYDLSARTYYRILKIARTIADLGESEQISCGHLAEAIRLKCSN